MENKNSSSTKVIVPGESPSGPTEELISLDDLDKLIEASDPEFSQKLHQLKMESLSSGENIDLLDLDEILSEEQSRTLRARWHRFQRRLFRWHTQVTSIIQLVTHQGVKQGLPFLFKKIKTAFAFFNHGLASTLDKFKYMGLGKKMILFGIIFLIFSLSYFMYRSWTHGVIPQSSPLFLNSLEDWASRVHIYKAQDPKESFYESSRIKQNIIALRRAVVNLKPSKGSGPNPMAFFELYAEGNSSDVTVELKDREHEVIDSIQRMMEEYSFEELDSADGKRNFLEKVRKELNSFLTKGKLKKIYIKQAIVKP